MVLRGPHHALPMDACFLPLPEDRALRDVTHDGDLHERKALQELQVDELRERGVGGREVEDPPEGTRDAMGSTTHFGEVTLWGRAHASRDG
jgi:hypothetical protein